MLPHSNVPYIQLRVVRDFRTIDPTFYYLIITIANIYSNQENRIKEIVDTIYNNDFISVLATIKYFNLKSRRV